MSRLRMRRFWAWPWELRRLGVIGLNARNLLLLSELNPRENYVRVNDKVLTKQLCQAAGIAVARTLAVLDDYGDLSQLEKILQPHGQFVLKPACGAAGRGVLVIVEHDGRTFRTCNGATLTAERLGDHAAQILSGFFSLGGRADRVLIEQRIEFDPDFDDVAVAGTPDIRIVVCKGRALLAMLRLPTRLSGGRGNLHQGAVGVGIDIRTGTTNYAVHFGRFVQRHPDTAGPLGGRQVPHWRECLELARKLACVVGLGYVGVDIVLDRRQGPLVLEANARPGLEIQLANRRGLLAPLQDETPVGS